MSGYYRCAGSLEGQASFSPLAAVNGEDLHDTQQDAGLGPTSGQMPVSYSRLVERLLLERYPGADGHPVGSGLPTIGKRLLQAVYYFFRPLLSVPIRRRLQKFYLRDWERISFPAWPLDRTVDTIFERVLASILKQGRQKEIPFIWFWPKGHSGALILTHDVEAASGRDFCPELMRMDESFGFRASFQIVPEGRYTINPSFLEQIRRRGFEINVHGLNHDGHLFRERGEFLRRVQQINQYGKRFAALGFRSPVLYRNPDWLGALDFQYDMSFPNVGHLDPQKGGCCTVMPYFIDHLLELPLTTAQDYTLLHILEEDPIEVWTMQVSQLLQGNGLISFNIHPDYMIPAAGRRAYLDLLEYLSELTAQTSIWTALPREVAKWWIQRSRMNIVARNGSLQITGKGSERACLARASLRGGSLVYEKD